MDRRLIVKVDVLAHGSSRRGDIRVERLEVFRCRTLARGAHRDRFDQYSRLGKMLGLNRTQMEHVAQPAGYPEAAGLPNPITLAEEGVSGSSGPRILHSLVMLEIYWGGICLHRSNGEWMLNGEKMFISQAQLADAAMVLSRFIAPDGSRGMTTFLVEKRTPGFTVGPQLRKLGIRSHDT